MNMQNKSTTEEIRQRFDGDVERFSNLETGQSATMDAPLVLEFLTSAAAHHNPQTSRVLDVGCGAGNFTLKLLEKLQTPRDQISVTLVDLSAPMLQRAEQRLRAVGVNEIIALQGDIRELNLGQNFDAILAAAVLHHLRQEEEWHEVFRKFYQILNLSGSLWISDLVTHENSAVEKIMWQKYAEYLQAFGGQEYQQKVFDYIQKEDSPRPLSFQLEVLRAVGFSQLDVLHKTACFAAFSAVK